jgi:hypothetical protein
VDANPDCICDSVEDIEKTIRDGGTNGKGT